MSKANVATARSKIGKVYAAGCTGFVSDVLGKPQKIVPFGQEEMKFRKVI